MIMAIWDPLFNETMKVPSPCEPFCEPSAVPSCEENGSSEASCEPSDETYFDVKVHLKLELEEKRPIGHFILALAEGLTTYWGKIVSDGVPTKPSTGT